MEISASRPPPISVWSCGAFWISCENLRPCRQQNLRALRRPLICPAAKQVELPCRPTCCLTCPGILRLPFDLSASFFGFFLWSQSRHQVGTTDSPLLGPTTKSSPDVITQFQKGINGHIGKIGFGHSVLLQTLNIALSADNKDAD